ncbi:MAG: LysR substrate-binding domain-containing protein [Pseudomonadota bacterium]
MSAITLKQLKYFAAVAEYGHFGRAAEACSISQPALSIQVRDLEATLGVRLLERGPRRLTVTRFGETFLERTLEILRSVNELSDLARMEQAQLGGRLRLGVIPTIGPYLLPRLIAQLDKAYPTLDLEVRETLTQQLIAELNSGQLDVALVALPISEPALEEHALFSEPLVLVRPKQSAPETLPPTLAHPDMLKNQRLLLLEEGHCFRDQALEFCTLGGRLGPQGLNASSLSTLVQMVGAGLGVTLLPQMAVAVETAAAPVSTAHFVETEPTRSIGLVWRKTNPLARQLKELAPLVIAAAETPLPPADRS